MFSVGVEHCVGSSRGDKHDYEEKKDYERVMRPDILASPVMVHGLLALKLVLENKGREFGIAEDRNFLNKGKYQENRVVHISISG